MGSIGNILTGILVLGVILALGLMNNDDFTDWLSAWIVRRLRGPVGEWLVNRRLRTLPPEYHLVKDLMILRGDIESRTTQIDHLVVSPYGLFVIETKNITGRLTAGDQYAQWIVRRNRKKVMMHSPTRQNFAHMKALQALLKVGDDFPMHSIVAFNNDMDLTRVQSRSPVVNYDDVVDMILSLSGPVRISGPELQRIESLITGDMISGRRARIKHIEDIKVDSDKRTTVREERTRRQKEREAAQENTASQETNAMPEAENGAKVRICSRCGAEMVLRTGPRGRFWGCKGYPKCRNTQSE